MKILVIEDHPASLKLAHHVWSAAEAGGGACLVKPINTRERPAQVSAPAGNRAKES